MFNRKEIAIILAITLILAFSFSLRDFGNFAYVLASIFFIIAINVFAKKISCHYFDSEIEVKLWEMHRYGLLGIFSGGYVSTHPGKKFRKPFPLGAFLPVITSIMSLGFFVWAASLVFDIKPKIYRAAKRHGLYSFSEMTEEHLGYIASAGILANLISAVIGYLIGFSTFSELSIYYAFFNMIPLSDLDGNKIFFGSIVLWSFLASLTLIGLGYVFLIV